MKRDMDLIRAILVDVADNEDPHRDRMPTFDGYSPAQVAYHVKLLHGPGSSRPNDLSGFDGPEWRPTELTWAGQDFLAATRSDRVWSKLKAQLKEQGLELPVAVIKDLAIKIAASAAGLTEPGNRPWATPIGCRRHGIG